MYIHLGLVILRITYYAMRNKDFKGVLSLQIISFPKVIFFYWLGIFWWSSIGLLYCISANNLTLCPWHMRHVLMNKSINEQCWSILLEPFFYSVGAEGLQVSYSHKLQAGPAAEQEIREVGKKSQEFRQKRKRHVCLYLSFRGFCIYIYIVY